MGVKATLKDVMSGFLSATTHTLNNTKIEQALDKALDRTASVDNAMEVPLDMGMQRIINMADGVALSDAVTMRQLVEAGVVEGGGLNEEQVQELIDTTIAATDIGDVFVGECLYSFANVYDMMASTTAAGAVSLADGYVVSAGLGIFDITTTATNLPIGGTSPALYAKAKGDLWADDFVNPADTDDAVGLRLMRDHAEALGRRVTLRSSGRNYALQSVEVVPTYGGNVGLYITLLNMVRVDFGGSQLYFDTATAGLGAIAKDAVLALAPQATGEGYAFGNIKNIDLNGGNWPTKAERPLNIIKGNYKTLAYCLFEDIRGLYSQEDGWVTDGFVMLMRKVRMRFAGTNSAGFRLETTSGAKTGYLIDGCTVDYAGNYGFNVTGASGHTYCHINNCHVDFVGRDDDGSFIEANAATAHAYRIRDTRTFNLTACGSEFCTSVLEIHNARSMSIDGLFSLGAGHLDGVTEIDHLIKCTGYFEQVTINNFENRSPKAGGFNCWLAVENAAAYNTNSIVVDKSISMGNIRFDGGNQTSSNLPLIQSPYQQFSGNYRKGPGDVVKTGSPELGASTTAPYSSTDVLEQTWYIQTAGAGVSQDLIDVFQRTDANTTFFFEFFVCRATTTAPSKYEGAITVADATHAIVAPTATEIGGSGANPTITFVADQIGVTLPNANAGYYIKVTAVQRPGANYTRFNWL